MQAAAAQGDELYMQPAFVSHIAAAQARLRIHNRSFWKRLHADLLPSWGPNASATIVHACGGLFTMHSMAEAAESAASGVSQVKTAADEDADVAGAASAAKSAVTTATASKKLGPPRKVDEALREFQQAAIRTYSNAMNAHGVANCVVSLGKQGMLHGEMLELCQGAVKRTVDTMTPVQISLVMWGVYNSGATLGVAEAPVREALVKVGVVTQLQPLLALRMLQVRALQPWRDFFYLIPKK